MKITTAQLKTLRTEMQAAFNKAGITEFALEVGNMRYGADEVTITVKGKLKGVTTKTDRVFEEKIAEYGLRTVGHKGEVLVGYTPSRYKFPFSYTTVRGARHKCSVAQAKELFS
jgi:hypothetical protein